VRQTLGQPRFALGLMSLPIPLTDRINSKTALWEVDGGQYFSQTDSTINHQMEWINPADQSKPTPIAPNGCQGKVQDYKLKLQIPYFLQNQKGQEGICGVSIRLL